jgi:competence CoiA-like predicted nuclease
MTKTILYSTATTSTGQMIHASDANKETAYTCPLCNQPFIFRKGTRKRPHFAHKTLTSNCTPETALHYSFKVLLRDKIQNH